MTEQILKSALGLLLLIGVAYAILAATVGRARLLELCFGPAPVQAVDFGNLVLKETSNQHLVCPQTSARPRCTRKARFSTSRFKA